MSMELRWGNLPLLSVARLLRWGQRPGPGRNRRRGGRNTAQTAGANGAVPWQADNQLSALVARFDHQPSTDRRDPLPEHDGAKVALGQLRVLEATAEWEALAIVRDRDPNPVPIEPDAHAHDRGQSVSCRVDQRLADDLMDLASELGRDQCVEASGRQRHVQLDREIATPARSGASAL